MRMSCNGCRVLRKGCSATCSIRPCLHWIKSAEAQANATVFLAKFYGRAGLINLINAGPDHLRPAIFRSMLYEACGRIVNPIYGSVGLLWSGNWHLCQTAVESVLRGSPINRISTESAVAAGVPGTKPYDIRHIPKKTAGDMAGDLHKVASKSRARFKRGPGLEAVRVNRTDSVIGSLVVQSMEVEGLPKTLEKGSEGSVETTEWSNVSQGEPEDDEKLIRVNLNLQLEPTGPVDGSVDAQFDDNEWKDDTRQVDLGLSL